MTYLSESAYVTARSGAGFTISFEAFPANSQAALDELVGMAGKLQAFEPEFLSVTYGAGGGTQSKTLDTIKSISNATDHRLAGHLTCVGASKSQSDAVIRQYYAMGIRHIVALRGDKPAGDKHYTAHPEGYRNAAGLVAGIARHGEFDISVAAYPETHPDSPSRKHDLENLKSKFDSGADRAITQFFFENTMFYRLLDDCADNGIDNPIVPGILLIHDFKKVCNFAARCNATIPNWLAARFKGLENDLEAQKLVAASFAAEQALDLAAQGVKHFHFFTLNRPDLALAVCRCLGISPVSDQSQAA